MPSPRHRLPKRNVYYSQSPEHAEGQFVLSFSFCFDVEEDTYQFTLVYPYSYSRLQAFLNSMDSNPLPFYRRTNMANSVVRNRVLAKIF